MGVKRRTHKEKKKSTVSPEGSQIRPGPTPRPQLPQRPGANLWDFHGGIIQQRHEQSIRYGQERTQQFVGNTFGAQPPEKEKR